MTTLVLIVGGVLAGLYVWAAGIGLMQRALKPVSYTSRLGRRPGGIHKKRKTSCCRAKIEAESFVPQCSSCGRPILIEEGLVNALSALWPVMVVALPVIYSLIGVVRFMFGTMQAVYQLTSGES